MNISTIIESVRKDLTSKIKTQEYLYRTLGQLETIEKLLPTPDPESLKCKHLVLSVALNNLLYKDSASEEDARKIYNEVQTLVSEVQNFVSPLITK